MSAITNRNKYTGAVSDFSLLKIKQQNRVLKIIKGDLFKKILKNHTSHFNFSYYRVLIHKHDTKITLYYCISTIVLLYTYSFRIIILHKKL